MIRIQGCDAFYCSGDQYVIESDGLVIQNVNRDNAGTYTCRARVPETGELEERDIQLDVSTYIQLDVSISTW
jgi:Immunoglobulin I-set domain